MCGAMPQKLHARSITTPQTLPKSGFGTACVRGERRIEVSWLDRPGLRFGPSLEHDDRGDTTRGSEAQIKLLVVSLHSIAAGGVVALEPREREGGGEGDGVRLAVDHRADHLEGGSRRL